MNEEENERFEGEQEDEELFIEDEAPEEEQPPEEDELPEKYRGKSLKDLVTMHQEAEKLAGRQGNEMGELRKTFDAFIQAQLNNKAQQIPQEEDDVDFYTDPDRAVLKTIDKHPDIQRMRALSVDLARQQTTLQLETKHPNYKEIVQDQGFIDWVNSSKVRAGLYAQANNNFDFDAADELLTLYQERKNLSTETKKVADAKRRTSLKAASTGSGRGSGERSQKILRESDIQELILKDRDKYVQLLPQITQAYLEGRVR